MLKFVVCSLLVVLLAVPSLQQLHLDLCDLKPEGGMCKGYFPRFAYDAAKHACVKFIYGGCGGNPNNFRMLSDCESKCAGV